MTWIPLSSRLNSIPLVLAGPILRRVEEDIVAVWLALKEARTITLTVFDEQNTPVMSAVQDTVSLGANLHVVVLTASLLPGKSVLLPGFTYQYNVTATGINLKANAEVCYNNYTLPTFSLPPATLNDLRITHASCRKLHASGNDALVALDGMINRASVPLLSEPAVYPPPSFARKRPHQLFLTGDQIYADDVDPLLLFLIRDAQQALLGWTEELPVGPATAPKLLKSVYPLTNLQPGMRSYLIEHESGLQFPGEWEVAANHLMTLGDYYCMYLLMWSPALWPATTEYPAYAQVYPTFVAIQPQPTPKQQEEFDHAVARAQDYPSQLGPIRRALANVPTYMICDDHEITDDWFLDMNWCKQVLSKALGRRILQNGMTAYALFQAWGNTPEQFTPGTPGSVLLDTISRWQDASTTLNYSRPDSQTTVPTGVNNPTYWDTMYALLGLPDLTLTIANRALTPIAPQRRIFYHYHIIWSAHEVFVLDTRTQRAYPGTKDANFPALISRPALEDQLSTFSSTVEVSFIVIATPISGVPHTEESLMTRARAGKAVDFTTESIYPSAENINYYTDAEAYGYQEEGLQNLYAVIADRVKLLQQSINLSSPARIVVLSGDVHYGFTNRVEFWGTRFYGMDDRNNSLTTPVHFILAQLCASALKNEKNGIKTYSYLYNAYSIQLNTGTFGPGSMHEEGYTPSELLDPAEFMCWVPAAPGAQQKLVGIWKYPMIGNSSAYWEIRKGEQVFDIRKKRLSSNKEPESLTIEPDWVYRINYIATIPGTIRPGALVPQPVTSPVGQSAPNALNAFLTAHDNYKTYFQNDGPGREIVGKNNIGEVFFEWGNTETTKIVRHSLWWSLTSAITGLDDPEKSPLSQFRVLLGEDSTTYPKPTA